MATKYRLRRKPGYDFPDLKPYIQNLSTLAKSAYLEDGPFPEKRFSTVRLAGQYLGIPGARPDPLAPIRKGPRYHGNLPLEILTYISAYIQMCIENGTMNTPMTQNQAMSSLPTLLDCLTGMERILGTPLPLSFRIAISQITWMYILILPFQLVTTLGWIAIPATTGTFYHFAAHVVTAYIVLGIALIGRELENPFGFDTNDLDLDGFVRDLKAELEILTASPPPRQEDYIKIEENWPLGPKSHMPYSAVKSMSVDGLIDCGISNSRYSPVLETEGE